MMFKMVVYSYATDIACIIKYQITDPDLCVCVWGGGGGGGVTAVDIIFAIILSVTTEV